MTRMRPFVAAFVLVLAFSRVPMAEAEGVFAGSCVVDIQARYSPGVGVLPTATSITLVGSGTCLVNGEAASMQLAGSVATNPATGGMGCAGGSAAFGSGTVQISLPGFPNPLVQLVVLRTGATVTIAAWALALKFEGIGMFVADAASLATCATGGSVLVETWKGVLTFQDPTFVP